MSKKPHRWVLTTYKAEGGYPIFEDFPSKSDLLDELARRDQDAYDDYIDKDTCYGKKGTYKIEFLY